MSLRAQHPLYAPLVYLAFFFSGAASLIAEVTWNRMLIVVVGNSLSATAMILVIFMGGLGLGSLLGGRLFGARRGDLRPYFLMELAVGALVLLSPVLIGALTGAFESAAGRIDAQAGLAIVRVLITSCVLLLPAMLMGATYPAIAAGAALDDPRRGSARTSYLYAINTLGAALGTYAAGYHLLLEFGVGLTLRIAFGLYLLAAGTGVLAGLLRRSAPRASEASAAPAADVSVATRRGFLLAASATIGFVALAYEVLLTRLSILYLGNAVSVFPLVLTAFLLGTGISALLGTRLFDRVAARPRGGDRLFAITAIAAGAAVFAAPYLLLGDWIVGAGEFARFADSTARNPLPVLLVIITPTLLLGALLPMAIRMLGGAGRGPGAARTAATLYAVNTAGGLLGAGVVNHLLVPAIGMQGALLLLALLGLAVGLIAALAPGRRPSRWGVVAASTALIGLLLGVAAPDMVDRYAQKIARGTLAERATVRLIREGRAATVTVLDQQDSRLGDYRDMYLNGVEEASTRYWHVQLFKLLGSLPVFSHASDAPKDCLVIAFGAGITAGSTLATDEVGRLDVVDLNPDIEEINDLFTEVNGDVFHRPRFHFHNDDGRGHLVTTHRRYDLIIGDSTHPRAYDSWILYTREFYELVKRRLAPGGVFAQWVPVLGSMRGELMRIHLNTFRTVFPNATVWYVYGSDQAFLMATPEPYALDAPRLQSRLDRLAPWFRAEHYQLDSVRRVGGFFWMDGSAMAAFIGPETRVNTDDAHYFDKQSAVWPLPPALQLPMFQAALPPHLNGGDRRLAEAILDEQRVAGLLASYGFYRNENDLATAWCLDPGNGDADWFMRLATGGRLPEGDGFCLENEMRQYRELIASHPDNDRALNGLADLLIQAGRYDEAIAAADRALALDPSSGMYLDTRGWALHKAGRSAEAVTVLERALTALPRHPIVLYHLGAAESAAGAESAGRRHLRAALEASSDFDGATEARSLLGQTDQP